MKYFKKHNWDVNLWISLQIVALFLAIPYIKLRTGLDISLGALSLLFLIALATWISVIAMLVRLNKIKKYRKWRVTILFLVAIQMVYSIFIKSAFEVYSVLIGG